MPATLAPMPELLGHRPAAGPFAAVSADLAETERILADAFAKYRTPFGPLVDHLQHYRGKRLRPAILLLAAKACGGVTPAHRTLAAAAEMIHTATLVHDDVLDDATIRRHVKTVNAGWGNRVAILLGDMLFSHAFHLTATVDRRACEIIGDATNRVCAGELRQVTAAGDLHLSEDDYLAIIDGKTAALTECCGRLAGLFANAPEPVVEGLASYGRNLGLAFQVADDLLDLTGTEAATGKTLGTDLAQGKLTLPLIHALQTLPRPKADEFRERLRAGDAAYTLNVLAKTRSLEYAKWRAEEFVRLARAGLAGLPHGECRMVLERLPEWSLRREA